MQLGKEKTNQQINKLTNKQINKSTNQQIKIMKLPKLAIIGFGAMGKEIKIQAEQLGYTITDIFDIDYVIEPKDYSFDVALDFSTADAVLSNVKILAKIKKNLVIGTTNWEKQFNEVKSIVEKSHIGVLYSSNFSIGMQKFFKIVEYSAKLFNKFDDYDFMLHEIHHKRKIDSPSGTALTLGNIILNELENKTKIVTETMHNKISLNSLHVTSTRGGEIAGTHTIFIDSIADTIELTHRAKNRTGLARGAIYAANLIFNRTGFYDFAEVI
ncbi:MAG TPA: 4-hydroxy-tetrahydrodipicolinate reductase [Candidatus Kapabacteria bacterium]|nr:4-hydroxy-tetrahydrodipicolinate reductase [Candidatus Kapabacteria bacterium]